MDLRSQPRNFYSVLAQIGADHQTYINVVNIYTLNLAHKKNRELIICTEVRQNLYHK